MRPNAMGTILTVAAAGGLGFTVLATYGKSAAYGNDAAGSATMLAAPVSHVRSRPGAPAVPAPPKPQEPFAWRGRIAAGKAIEIRGVNGDVRALPASGGQVEVTATKSGRRSDPAEVEVRVIEHEDGVTICAVYPAPPGPEPNECVPGGGRMNTHNNDVQVDFTVRVPAGIGFTGHTVNGGIEIGELDSDVEAHTVNGAIGIARARTAEARTVNGSITAALTRADWTRSLDFETVNGSITLTLPANTNADVRARTVNGSIETDFPLTVKGRFGPRSVNGTIGNGGRQLDLETVNGKIRLRRGA